MDINIFKYFYRKRMQFDEPYNNNYFSNSNDDDEFYNKQIDNIKYYILDSKMDTEYYILNKIYENSALSQENLLKLPDLFIKHSHFGPAAIIDKDLEFLTEYEYYLTGQKMSQEQWFDNLSIEDKKRIIFNLDKKEKHFAE